jgi:hypothetical protein
MGRLSCTMERDLMKRLLVILAVCAGLLTAAPAIAAAQQATPGAGPGEITGVPDPAECTVEPRSYENITAIFATPVAGAPAMEATPAAPELPGGDPVDAETEQAVLATLRETVACINAQSFWQITAFYSDDFLRELLTGGGVFTEDDYNELTTPQPLPEDQRTEIIEVLGVQMLPDGRVAALVVGDDLSNPKPASPTLFYFIEQEGRWLIDGFVTTPDDATPAP